MEWVLGLVRGVFFFFFFCGGKRWEKGGKVALVFGLVFGGGGCWMGLDV